MTELTRRRDKEAPREKWDIFYGDVRVGSIEQRAGVPNHVDQWEWRCGFYPGCDRSTGGPAGTFDEARAAFEAEWQQLLTEQTSRPGATSATGSSAGRPCGHAVKNCLLKYRRR